MSTDLLEKPGTVPAAARETIPSAPNVAARPAPTAAKIGEPKLLTPEGKIERMLRRIFEGHEEYLGWTPD